MGLGVVKYLDSSIAIDLPFVKKYRWPEARRIPAVGQAEYLCTCLYMRPAQTDGSLLLVGSLNDEREPSGHTPIIQVDIGRPPSNVAAL